MDKRYLKATAAILCAFSGACTIASMDASPAYAWTDVTPAGVNGCISSTVNDAGTAVGTCKAANGNWTGYVRLPTASSSTLLAPSTLSCSVGGINNAAAGSEIITGSCDGVNGVSQSVYWTSANPTVAPTLLHPLSVLGQAPDVQTRVQGVNVSGVMVGVSVNSRDIGAPVTWSSAGLATQLPTPPLTPRTTCNIQDINDAATPSIIANCGDLTNFEGRIKAILWRGTASAYKVLQVPKGAWECRVDNVNFSGQVLGTCGYTGNIVRIAVWGPGGTGPTLMNDLGSGGQIGLSTSGLAINDNGVVACRYRNGTYQYPCRWDTKNGNKVGVAISPPAGATGDAIPTSIGLNGKIIGTYRKSGVNRPYYVEPGGMAAIDGASPAGGPNTKAMSMSKSGVNEIAAAEDASLHTRAETQKVP